nr:hypothetical protein BaRGS_007339 [Batillaria attramentaria]
MEQQNEQQKEQMKEQMRIQAKQHEEELAVQREQMVWKQLGKPKLDDVTHRYESASKHDLPVLGTFMGQTKDPVTGKQSSIPYIVTKIHDLNLLGRNAIQALGISVDNALGLKSIESQVKSEGAKESHPKTSSTAYASLQKDCHTLCDKFPDLFKEELGCLKDFELEVKFKSDAKPVFSQGKAEELMQKLGGGFGYTKIDLADAYNQIKLAPESQRRLALSTHRGFYGKFIPNLATMAEPLYRLTKKANPWKWGEEEQAAFEQLKNVLSSNQVLVHFDPDKPVGLACDASNVGIGAVLFHRYPDGSERPIANVSKTLTAAERNYSQIHKEALAIIYGLRKFYQYLYGRQFILVTDHKPLTALFGPKKGTPLLAANRLARWALWLNQFDYTIEYRKTADHGNADALSRLPSGDDIDFDREESGDDTDMVCAIRVLSLQVKPFDANILRQESGKDPVIATVMRYVREGWPLKHAEINEEVKKFQKLSDSLSICHGCLIYGTRVVIPQSLQPKILDLLHIGHFGMERMKQLARTAVYWPAQGKQSKEASKTQVTPDSGGVAKVTRQYKAGDPVYALYYGPHHAKQPRWVPAVVKKSTDKDRGKFQIDWQEDRGDSAEHNSLDQLLVVVVVSVFCRLSVVVVAVSVFCRLSVVVVAVSVFWRLSVVVVVGVVLQADVSWPEDYSGSCAVVIPERRRPEDHGVFDVGVSGAGEPEENLTSATVAEAPPGNE